jgi:hypothetical protein
LVVLRCRYARRVFVRHFGRRPVLRPGQGTVLQHVPASVERGPGPANIASYAMLTMIAHHLKCDAGVERQGGLSHLRTAVPIVRDQCSSFPRPLRCAWTRRSRTSMTSLASIA